jgi:ABC-2 type transport system ATP-binding protein
MELALDLCDEIVLLNQGILEEVDKTGLDQEALKHKIIEMLKGEER